jgi:ABC-type uncharacterized transport system auxiliary subunit
MRLVRGACVAGPAGVVILSACFHSAPPLQLYRLQPVDTPAAQDSPVASEVIAVEPYATVGIYGEPHLVYRVGQSTYGAYPNAEWVIPLTTMLADITAAQLRAAEPHIRVTTGQSAGASDLLWRAKVQQFEEVDSAAHVSASVSLEAMLVRSRSDSIVWQGSTRLEQAVPEPTMSAVVATLSELANNAVSQLVREADGALRTSAQQLAHP